jgi:GNAT superfamily N-acetyltransferase
MGGAVVGHVALHQQTTLEALALACRHSGLDQGQLGVVARLMVAPTCRGAGIGTALLGIATEEARRRALLPVLDVHTGFLGPVRLYEANGWQRIGVVEAALPNGTVQEAVYVLPATMGPRTT